MEQNTYSCRACGWTGAGERDHCPCCLCALHTETDEDGFPCGGTLEAVSVWVKPDDSWDILGRCRRCGELFAYSAAGDDDPMKLLSVASRPLAMPPFPIEKTAELTKLMGGQGELGRYFHESGE